MTHDEEMANFLDDYDDECADDLDCTWCCGDGVVESDDPIWDGDDWVKCSSCNGSGLRKDMTIW